MKGLIDKHIRKHCQISGSNIHIPTNKLEDFSNDVKEIFGADKFFMSHWILNNIGHEYTMTFEGGRTERWSSYTLNNTDGPAITFSDGSYIWFVDGRHHRLDGPALYLRSQDIYNCTKGGYFGGIEAWYKDGELHRLDGPALIHHDGSTTYSIEGERLTKLEFDERTN